MASSAAAAASSSASGRPARRPVAPPRASAAVKGDASRAHVFDVRVYYEDTDFTGAVYHANYLKFFERAREHLLGPDHLVNLYDELGFGFVVYKAQLTYKAAAHYGDVLEIWTSPSVESGFRVSFDQVVRKKGGDGTPMVIGYIEMVCVDKENQIVELPPIVTSEMQRFME